MANTFDRANRIISGTHGYLWLDGELVAECYGFQAKIAANKEAVAMAGQMYKDSKVMSLSGTGSVRMHKVSSRMITAVGTYLQQGKDPRFTIISKLADPDSFGAERISISNVSFDDVTLADWEADKLGTVECPFTFSGGFEPLDTIDT